MLLAELELPKLAIPEGVRRNARTPLIDTSRANAPDGAIWISCCYANPHVDKGKGWDHQVFLTVSVLSSHMAGDALSEHPQGHVPPGLLFVVDPLVTHWLVDKDSWELRIPALMSTQCDDLTAVTAGHDHWKPLASGTS